MRTKVGGRLGEHTPLDITRGGLLVIPCVACKELRNSQREARLCLSLGWCCYCGDREYDTSDTCGCCLIAYNEVSKFQVAADCLTLRLTLLIGHQSHFFGTVYSSVPVPLAQISIFQANLCYFPPTFHPAVRYRNG